MKLKQRKIEIIDTTLITLWENYRCSFKRNLDKIMELIKLIYIAGADYIEITDELYRFMLKLPEDVEFMLDYYKSIEIKGVDELKENIMIFENNKKIKRLRIIGLDDLILNDYEDILYEVIEKLEDRVELSITDKYKCSTGIAVEWIRVGGKKIVTSFAGIAGNTPLEELLGALRYVENINIRGDFRVFKKISKLYEEITCTSIPPTKPLIGNDIFNVESGIHVNGIIKNSKTFEPYNPEEVGGERKIIIGKHSGIKSLKIKLEELKIEYNSECLDAILIEVRNQSNSKGRGLNDDEIKAACKRGESLCEKKCEYC